MSSVVTLECALKSAGVPATVLKRIVSDDQPVDDLGTDLTIDMDDFSGLQRFAESLDPYRDSDEFVAFWRRVVGLMCFAVYG